jgi:hypothetical protein
LHLQSNLPDPEFFLKRKMVWAPGYFVIAETEIICIW